MSCLCVCVCLRALQKLLSTEKFRYYYLCFIVVLKKRRRCHRTVVIVVTSKEDCVRADEKNNSGHDSLFVRRCRLRSRTYLLFAHCNAIIITHRSMGEETPRIVYNVIISKTAVTYMYYIRDAPMFFVRYRISGGRRRVESGACAYFTRRVHTYIIIHLNRTCDAAGTYTCIQRTYIYSG